MAWISPGGQACILPCRKIMSKLATQTAVVARDSLTACWLVRMLAIAAMAGRRALDFPMMDVTGHYCRSPRSRNSSVHAPASVLPFLVGPVLGHTHHGQPCYRTSRLSG